MDLYNEPWQQNQSKSILARGGFACKQSFKPYIELKYKIQPKRMQGGAVAVATAPAEPDPDGSVESIERIERFNRLKQIIEIRAEPKHDFGKAADRNLCNKYFSAHYYGDLSGEQKTQKDIKNYDINKIITNDQKNVKSKILKWFTKNISKDLDTLINCSKHERALFTNLVFKQKLYKNKTDNTNFFKFKFWEGVKEDNGSLLKFDKKTAEPQKVKANNLHIKILQCLKENNIKYYLFDTSAGMEGSSVLLNYLSRNDIKKIVPINNLWDPSSSSAETLDENLKKFGGKDEQRGKLFAESNINNTDYEVHKTKFNPRRETVINYNVQYYENKEAPIILNFYKGADEKNGISINNLARGYSVYELSALIDNIQRNSSLVEYDEKDKKKNPHKFNKELIDKLNFLIKKINETIKDKNWSEKVQKQEITKLLLDLKKSGDWGQIRFVEEWNKLNPQGKCLFVSGDKLCALMSILNGNATLFGTTPEMNKSFAISNNLIGLYDGISSYIPKKYVEDQIKSIIDLINIKGFKYDTLLNFELSDVNLTKLVEDNFPNLLFLKKSDFNFVHLYTNSIKKIFFFTHTYLGDDTSSVKFKELYEKVLDETPKSEGKGAIKVLNNIEKLGNYNFIKLFFNSKENDWGFFFQLLRKLRIMLDKDENFKTIPQLGQILTPKAKANIFSILEQLNLIINLFKSLNDFLNINITKINHLLKNIKHQIVGIMTLALNVNSKQMGLEEISPQYIERITNELDKIEFNKELLMEENGISRRSSRVKAKLKDIYTFYSDFKMTTEQKNIYDEEEKGKEKEAEVKIQNIKLSCNLKGNENIQKFIDASTKAQQTSKFLEDYFKSLLKLDSISFAYETVPDIYNNLINIINQLSFKEFDGNIQFSLPFIKNIFIAIAQYHFLKNDKPDTKNFEISSSIYYNDIKKDESKGRKSLRLKLKKDGDNLNEISNYLSSNYLLMDCLRDLFDTYNLNHFSLEKFLINIKNNNFYENLTDGLADKVQRANTVLDEIKALELELKKPENDVNLGKLVNEKKYLMAIYSSETKKVEILENAIDTKVTQINTIAKNTQNELKDNLFTVLDTLEKEGTSADELTFKESNANILSLLKQYHSIEEGCKVGERYFINTQGKVYQTLLSDGKVLNWRSCKDFPANKYRKLANSIYDNKLKLQSDEVKGMTRKEVIIDYMKTKHPIEDDRKLWLKWLEP